jgi:hypothetical protein
MTIRFAHASPDQGGNSVASTIACCDLGRVVGIAEELLAAVRGGHDTSPLLRLASGRGKPHDAAQLSCPVKDSRLLWANLADREASQILGRVDFPTGVHAEPDGSHAVVALVREYPRQYPAAQAEATARRLMQQVPDATFGISSVLTDAQDLPGAFAEARAASQLATSAACHVVRADERWAEVAALRLEASLSSALPLDNPLRRLHDYDAKTQSSLLVSVQAWLRCNGDVTAAATTLHLHHNTLRYRLRRAQAVSGLDLQDPRARALLQLVLAR